MNKLSPQQLFNQAESARLKSNIGRYGKARLFLLGVSGISFTLAFVQKKIYKPRSQAEIEFKKERLQEPITELTDASGTTIPWSAKTADEWLYKPVRITGRPIHNRTCLIPDNSYGLEGFQYVVPLCTKETDDGIPLEGVFLNKGFIPKDNAHVSTRFKIEDSFHYQTFTGFVSKLEKHSDHAAFQKGNSPDFARNHWNYADLKDMAKVAGFENQSLSGAAVIESCNLETPLDERNCQHLDIACDYREDYPYRKTRAAALQSNNMPWHCDNKGNTYFNLGFASGLVALALSF